MSTLTQLEYLIAVDQEKHFGKAAQTCHVSQPSLSTQIQKLEDELGLILFDRSKKPILTTETGQEIIDQAKVILKEHKKLQAIADQGSKTPRGRFELAVIPTLASYLIPLFVGDFAKQFPKVHLKINEYKTEDIIKMLINDEVDAGLLVTPLEDDRLIELPLFYEPFSCYLSAEHALLQKKNVDANDLDVSELWLLAEGHCFRNQVLNVCSANAPQSGLANIGFESGNLETLIKLIKANSGFTLLPQLAVDELPASEQMEHIRPFQTPVPTREVSLVYSRSFLKSNTIQALKHSIQTHLPPKLQRLKKQRVQVIDI